MYEDETRRQALPADRAEDLVRGSRDELSEMVESFPALRIALKGAEATLSSGLAAAGRGSPLVRAGLLRGAAASAVQILDGVLARHPEHAQTDSRVLDVTQALRVVAQAKLAGDLHQMLKRVEGR